MASTITGPNSRDKSNITQIATVNPVGGNRDGLDVVAHSTASVLATSTVDLGSDDSIIFTTVSTAIPGDLIYFTTGPNAGLERTVASIDPGTSITLGSALPHELEEDDSFEVLRRTTPRVSSTGAQETTRQLYQIKIDEIGGGVLYLGEALPGLATSDPVWRIRQITETGDDLSLVFADGDSSFNNIWNDRLSLTY